MGKATVGPVGCRLSWGQSVICAMYCWSVAGRVMRRA